MRPSAMPAASKRLRAPAELESEESKAHEAGESPEDEVREGSEDAPKAKTNRRRSAKNAKNAKRTKAPMDSEGCGCGGKKGASCDGNCGGYAKKMDRGDALTPQEYLAACDLGIQGRSRSYIRARLDSATRLDLKCGKGSISEGEKCHVGAAKKLTAIHNNGRPLTNRQVRKIERSIVLQEANTGKKSKLSPEQMALLIRTPGTQSRRMVASSLVNVKGKELKTAVKASKGGTDPLQQAVRRVAKRELFNRRVQTAARVALGAAAISAAVGAGRRRDSVYATGFSPELDQLAI